MKLHLHPFTLALRHTFTISHGRRDKQETLVVELRQGDLSGFGEAAAISYYGVSVAAMVEDLEKIRPLIEENAHQTPEALWNTCAPLLSHNSFALCALDMAMHDLWGKKMGKPLYQLWNLSLERLPLSNYTIGIDTVDNMLKKMQEFPWPVYKIKLGTAEDVAIVTALRKHSQAIFRVDANGAWTAEETISNAKAFKELGVEFIEQPLPASSITDMKAVYQQAALPLIADESCIREEDIAQCSGHFHGVNIKLAKCGGLTPARRMIAQARQQGLQVMVGCMTESTVGISAIAQLLPLLDYVDMDGALLLKEDIAEGVRLRDGLAVFPERNGTGAMLYKSATHSQG